MSLYSDPACRIDIKLDIADLTQYVWKTNSIHHTTNKVAYST